ncbi:hypothetical protein [Collinsella vaginalis]|uniref:hypothetical protein n=1 Tax=Collinsella vaginalis TaxID=1870987 RepID=UPI0015C5076A|nr:hypothetical protein [Collinsella vaginalis]
MEIFYAATAAILIISFAAFLAVEWARIRLTQDQAVEDTDEAGAQAAEVQLLS